MNVKRFVEKGLVSLFVIIFSGLINVRRANAVELVLEDLFDSGPLDMNKWKVSFWPISDGIYPEIVSSPTRAGSGSVKKIVQYNWNGNSESNRCEQQGRRQKEPRKGQHIGYYQRFDESWTGFSIYFPSESWGPDDSREVVFQTHGSADSGEPSRSPPLSLKVDKGSTECFWQIRWDGDFISNHAQPSGPNAGVVEIWQGPIQKDQWTDWVIHAIWDYASDGVGFTEIWRNGTKVASRNGPNMYNDAAGMRGPIFGIYKWDWRDGPTDVTERIIYHDEFRDGDHTASYKDVDPAQRDNSEQSAVLIQEETTAHILPTEFELSNYPNPFNQCTIISYSMPAEGRVKLTVYDMTRRMVSTLLDRVQSTGKYKHLWEAVDNHGNPLPTGLYLCQFQVGSHVEMIKMMLLR